MSPFYYLCLVYKQFESNILKNQLFSKGDSLVLAISGGVDSVVLAHLLKKAGFNFSLAHCNFKLREKDSDLDEAFCRDLSKELGVKFFTQQFDVDTYCKKNKISIQMAARELRYNWFKELMAKHKTDYLVTAHHANDVVETLFINLCRGTGINGLKGIPEKTETIVRPLLNFTKEEITAFAKKEKIKFRTDKSNLEAKYERNFLRLNVIPKLRELHPNLEHTFLNNVANFKEEAEIVNDYLVEKTKQLVAKKDELITIDKILLKKEKHITSLLHYILEPLGFNITQIIDIKANLLENGESGKTFVTSSYTLSVDRKYLVIKSGIDKSPEPIIIFSLSELKNSDLLKVHAISDFKTLTDNELVIEKDKLIYPLVLRPKKTGDKFKPFGMKGFKLLSDFLKDQKLNLFEKEKCRVLENGNGDIIWVVGFRSDERYKVTNKENNLLKLTYIG